MKFSKKSFRSEKFTRKSTEINYLFLASRSFRLGESRITLRSYCLRLSLGNCKFLAGKPKENQAESQALVGEKFR